MRSKVAALVLVVFTALIPPVAAATPSTTPKCAIPEYRQTHLQECNRQGGAGLGFGGGQTGGGGGGGLLGLVGDLVGGLTGVLI
jgi:hypothetical protein